MPDMIVPMRHSYIDNLCLEFLFGFGHPRSGSCHFAFLSFIFTFLAGLGIYLPRAIIVFKIIHKDKPQTEASIFTAIP